MESLLGNHLTHKDRALILKSLSNISLDPDETDDSLIRNVSIFLRENPPASRAEASYQQFGLDLINYLRLHPDDPNSDYARRALKFLRQTNSIPNFIGTPAVKAFVAGLTLHEISGNRSLRFADERQGLTTKERQAAEEILLELADSHQGGDAQLLEETESFVASLGDDEPTRIVARFLRNIHKFTEVLSTDCDWTDEQKAWARGALKYIHLGDDAINDDLGLIGLLDDMYIAGMAVRFIDPVVQPIEELTFDLYAAWPFLRDLVLTHETFEYAYSEFALINTALACPALTIHETPARSALVVPHAGITAFVIAFGAALGFAYDGAASNSDHASFTPGQRVRVDNDAIAIYDGVDEIQGQTYIRLKQTYTRSGQQLDTISRIPTAQVGRICPAAEGVTTKGKIPTRVDDSSIPLEATETLFYLPYAQTFRSLGNRIWLVTNVTVARTLASGIRLYGHPLSTVLPMGHVKRDGEFIRWTSHFGMTDSFVTVISDLDTAAEVLEEQDLSADDLIIIDLSGINRTKFASLQYIHSLSPRILCVTEEKDTDTIDDLEKKKFGFWEWAVDEIKELYPGDDIDRNSRHPFHFNDAEIFRSILLAPDTTIVQSSEAEQGHADLKLLAQQIRNAGDDAPEEAKQLLDEMLDLAFQLIRAPMPLREIDGGAEHVIDQLHQIAERSRRSLYLEADQRELAIQAVDSLRDFALALKGNNPKAEAIQELLKSGNESKILVTPRYSAEVTSRNGAWQPALFLTWTKLRDVECDSILIPYWPGRRIAWELFSRPPTARIHFILYSFEDEWRMAFNRKRDIAKSRRARQANRTNLFARAYKWRHPPTIKQQPIIQEYPPTNLLDQRDIRLRQRILHAASSDDRSPDTQARMVVFHGGAHAFFTQAHEAWCATHLIRDGEDTSDSGETLRAVKVGDIVQNDILVFLRGTDRDAIRALADLNLPQGMRAQAKLWQISLRNHVATHGVTLRELQNSLAAAGCQRHVATLRQWLESESLIGPRNYASGDLRAIAEVTGDQSLRERLDECANAISRVWGEHLRASHIIAKRILTGIEDKITFGVDLEAPLEIGDDLVIAQVEYVDDNDVKVSQSVVNQLREDV